MAEYTIDKFKYGGNTYNLQGIYPVIGTQTASTNAWTGEINLNELYDGLTIAYYLPWAGTSAAATLNLTLKNGTTTGAIPVMYNSTTAVTNHYGVGTTILLTYWSAGSISISGDATTAARWTLADYNYNSNTIGEYGGSCTAGSVGMVRYSLAMKISENEWESLVTTSSTGTTKTKNSHGFLIDSPIIYQNASGITDGKIASSSSCWTTISFDTRYSTNGNQFGTAGKPFYLVGTIEDGKFYLADEWWANEISTAQNGYFYIYVGQFYSKYQANLYPYHPIYYCSQGVIRQYTPGTISNYSRWIDTKMVMFGDSIVNGAHDTIAELYSSSSTYNIGDQVLYGAQEGDEDVYRCITTISTPEAWNANHWEEVNTKQNRGYVKRLRQILGFKNCVNKGISGSTITVGARTDGVSSINETIHSVSASTFLTYSLVVIAGGINDFRRSVALGSLGQMGDTNFDTTTFYGSFRDMIEYLISCNPNMHICLMTPLQCNNKSKDVNYVNDAGLKILDYANAIKDVGVLYGIQVIDAYACSGLNEKNLSTLTEDGLHPNKAGYDFITPIVAQHLNSGASESQPMFYEKILNRIDDDEDRIYNTEVNFAGPYRDTDTYIAGEYIRNLDDGYLYQANTDITTAESWNENHWTQTRASIEFRRLHHLIANDYNPTSTYSVGDYVIRTSRLYKCNTAITTAQTWNSNHWTQIHLTEEFGNIIGLNYDYSDRYHIQLKDESGTDLYPNINTTMGDNITIGTDNTAIATGATTNKGTFVLTKGSYIVSVNVTWQSNATGYRQVGVAYNNTDQFTTGYRDRIVRSAAIDGANVLQQLTFPIIVTQSSETLYVNVRQNSGTDLTALTRVSYIGI